MCMKLYLYQCPLILILFCAHLVIWNFSGKKQENCSFTSLFTFILIYLTLPCFYWRELCNPCRKTRPVCMCLHPSGPLPPSLSLGESLLFSAYTNNNNNNNNSNNDGMLLHAIIFEHVIVKKGRPAVTASIIVIVTVYVAVPSSSPPPGPLPLGRPTFAPINRASPCVLWFHLGQKKERILRRTRPP